MKANDRASSANAPLDRNAVDVACDRRRAEQAAGRAGDGSESDDPLGRARTGRRAASKACCAHP